MSSALDMACSAPGRGCFAYGIQTVYRGLTVAVHLYPSATVVGRRRHRYHIFGDIYAYGETLVVDVGEVLDYLVGWLVGYVRVNP